MLAMDQIKKACEMDPNNQEYIQAARSIQASGRVYRDTGEARGFSMNFMDPGMLCCMCLAINMCMGGVLTFFLRILTLAIGEDWAFLLFLAVPSVILFVIVLKYIRGEADR